MCPQPWSHKNGTCTAGVYLLLKCGMLVERASLLLSSAKAILWQEASYGQYAKPEEVMESGNQCSICQVRFCPVSQSCIATTHLLDIDK